MIKELLATNILQARLDAKITQKQLASMIGVHHNQIGKWELGKAAPEVPNVEALAVALGKPAVWFFHEHRAENETRVVEVDWLRTLTSFYQGFSGAVPGMKPLPPSLTQLQSEVA